MVEAPFELGEVADHVLLANGAVGAEKRALDVAEHGVHPLEGGMARGPATRPGRDRHMHAAGISDAAEAREAICHHGRARRDDALREAPDTLAFEACDAAELDAPRPSFLIRLNGHDNRLLAGAATAALSAAALAAQVGIVHLECDLRGAGLR